MTGFRDFRLTQLHTETQLEDGGIVIVYSSSSDAEKMIQWLETVSRNAPFSSLNYRHGNVVLRLTNRLSDEQVADYNTYLDQTIK